MTLALVVDCAAPEIGLAVGTLGDPQPMWTWSARVERGADGLLGPALAEALGLLWADRRLGVVVVTIGPGTFTGLRVGLSTALGVALAADLPVIPLCSLRARAAMVEGPGPVLALLDARKGRMYGACFRDGGAEAVPGWAPADLPLEALLPAAPFIAVGEGAVVARAAVEAAGGVVYATAAQPPLGAALRLAARLPAVDPAAVTLAYIRPPDAVVPAALAARRALIGS